MEYMAMRKPTVCFRTCENEVTAGESALYASDLSAFTDMTIRLMDDADLRARMGAIGRQRIDEGLTWDKQAIALVSLYRDLFNLEADD